MYFCSTMILCTINRPRPKGVFMKELSENDSQAFDCFKEGIDKAWLALEHVTGYNEIRKDGTLEELSLVVLTKIKEGQTRSESFLIAYAISNLIVEEDILDYTIFESSGQMPDMLDNDNLAKSILEGLYEDAPTERYHAVIDKIKAIDRVALLTALDKNITNMAKIPEEK